MLDSLFAWYLISDISLLYSAESTYLRKLGWPGVCEFGAGVPLVLPWPSAASGGVSSLMTLLETDISSDCSRIDSSPTDGYYALMEGKLGVFKFDREEVTSVACAVGGNRSPEQDLSLGISRFAQALRGSPLGLEELNFELTG
jgi:hypothetical protein